MHFSKGTKISVELMKCILQKIALVLPQSHSLSNERLTSNILQYSLNTISQSILRRIKTFKCFNFKFTYHIRLLLNMYSDKVSRCSMLVAVLCRYSIRPFIIYLIFTLLKCLVIFVWPASQALSTFWDGAYTRNLF